MQVKQILPGDSDATKELTIVEASKM